MRLYVGGDAATVRGERVAVTGYRMFSAGYRVRSRFSPAQAAMVYGMLDSGAFTDEPAARCSFEAAVERQLQWEVTASRLWGTPWRAEALVSYDRLIDEQWHEGRKRKERWALSAGWAAVEETQAAAYALTLYRQALLPRRLVLSCQGVDRYQYRECAAAILSFASRRDILGLGGWCILGQRRSLLPEYTATLELVLPLVRSAGLKRVHIFGVLWLPALAVLVHECRRHRLLPSTDGGGPILACAWSDAKKSGRRAETVAANVRWWRRRLAELSRAEGKEWS